MGAKLCLTQGCGLSRADGHLRSFCYSERLCEEATRVNEWMLLSLEGLQHDEKTVVKPKNDHFSLLSADV